MLYDAKFEFGDDVQLIATDTTSYIGTGKEVDWVLSGLNLGQGTPMYLNIVVGTTAYSGGTSCQFFLEVDDTSEGHDGTGKVIMMTDAIPVGDLGIGAVVYSGAVPVDVDADRYLQVGMTAVGTVAAGTINAWLSNAPLNTASDLQVDESNI